MSFRNADLLFVHFAGTGSGNVPFSWQTNRIAVAGKNTGVTNNNNDVPISFMCPTAQGDCAYCLPDAAYQHHKSKQSKAISNVVSNTCAFSAMISQNVCCCKSFCFCAFLALDSPSKGWTCCESKLK